MSKFPITFHTHYITYRDGKIRFRLWSATRKLFTEIWCGKQFPNEKGADGKFKTTEFTFADDGKRREIQFLTFPSCFFDFFLCLFLHEIILFSRKNEAINEIVKL